MYCSAGQIFAILYLVVGGRSAPVSPPAASLTVSAAPSAPTPLLALQAPPIAPFSSVAAYFTDPSLDARSFDPSETSVFQEDPADADVLEDRIGDDSMLDSRFRLAAYRLFRRANETSSDSRANSTTADKGSNSTSPVKSTNSTSSFKSTNSTSSVKGTNMTSSLSRKGFRTARKCVGSGANETTINALLYYGGKGAVVKLCLGAVINIQNPIFFSAANQVITTAGEPEGNSRATIVVQGKSQACAIYAAVPGANNVVLRNVQVNGNRPNLGIIYGGIALLEFGGNTVGQKVENVHAYEPRGWSALHSAEGGQGSYACSSMEIIGNQIGPSGNSPTGKNQFRRRDSPSYTPGQWADGISHACPGSVVKANVVTDATDGAIVIFGAPGSTISSNTIVQKQRVALGGINAVDFMPFGGTFEGTVVKNNHLHAESSMIKVGIAIGGMVWGVDNRTASRTWGGEFLDNEFSTGENGYFSYAIGVSGHKGAKILGNKVSGKANFGGVDSAACFSGWFPLPSPQPFIADPTNTPSSTFQDDFWLKSVLVLLICKGPGAILSSITA